MSPALDYFAQYVKFLCYLLFCLFEKTIEYDLVFFFLFPFTGKPSSFTINTICGLR